MTSIDPKTFFTALAFIAVVRGPRPADDQQTAAQIREFAGLIEEFCVATAADNPACLPDDADATAIDQTIGRHIRELREKEITVLPRDRESLIKLYDRLNYRNQRRINRQLYPTFNTSKLADMVLDYLDNEIEQSSNGDRP